MRCEGVLRCSGQITRSYHSKMPFPTYLAITKELVKRPVLVCVLLEWATRTITRDIERVIRGLLGAGRTVARIATKTTTTATAPALFCDRLFLP